MSFKYTDADDYNYDLGLSPTAMITVVLLATFIINFTSVGCKIYALGENRESADRIGFSVSKLQLLVYGYMGLMSGAVGIVQLWTTMIVAPSFLLGYELTALAVAAPGGAGLLGGHGMLTDILLGVVLLVVMQNGLNLLGVSSYWQMLTTGIIIIASINATTRNQHQNRSLL